MKRGEVETQAEEVVKNYNKDSVKITQMKALIKAVRKELPNSEELIIITIDSDGIAHTNATISERYLIALLEMVKHTLIHRLFGRGL